MMNILVHIGRHYLIFDLDQKLKQKLCRTIFVLFLINSVSDKLRFGQIQKFPNVVFLEKYHKNMVQKLIIGQIRFRQKRFPLQKCYYFAMCSEVITLCIIETLV